MAVNDLVTKVAKASVDIDVEGYFHYKYVISSIYELPL